MDIQRFKSILPVATDQEFPINARDLHKALQVKTPFKDWIKRRLNDTDAIEDRDYRSNLSTPSGHENIGQTQRKDYNLTLPLAKEISMLERNAIGKLVRRYFIQCEEQLKTQQPNLEKALDDPSFLKKALLVNLEKVEKLELENKVMTPKAEAHDAFMDCGEDLTMQEAGALLNVGRNNLKNDLRGFGYLMANGLPYRKYLERGWFKVKVDQIGYKFPLLTPKGFQNIASKHYSYTELFGVPEMHELEMVAA